LKIRGGRKMMELPRIRFFSFVDSSMINEGFFGFESFKTVLIFAKVSGDLGFRSGIGR